MPPKQRKGCGDGKELYEGKCLNECRKTYMVRNPTHKTV